VALDDILDISFEFSSKIGVRDLPRVDANKESDVRGLYVVGDLADAPIIKAALAQGYQVAKHIARRLGRPSADEDLYDVVVVGAGPGGIGAGLALCETGHRFVILERQRPFDTIQNFPKHKVIFAEPARVPTVAGFWFDDATTEALIERWGQALEERSLPIAQPEDVVDIRKTGDRFEVETRSDDGTTRVWRARRVILAIGRRYMERIREDSLCRVKTRGLLGEKIITVRPGSDEKPPIALGGEIPSEEPSDLQDTIATAGEGVELTATEAAIVLRELRKILTDVQEKKGLLGKLIYSDEFYQDTFKRIDTLIAEFKKEIEQLNKTLQTQVVHFREDSTHAIEELEKEMRQTGEDLRATSTTLRKRLDEAGALIEEIRQGKGTAGMLVQDEAFAVSLKARRR